MQQPIRRDYTQQRLSYLSNTVRFLKYQIMHISNLWHVLVT